MGTLLAGGLLALGWALRWSRNCAVALNFTFRFVVAGENETTREK